MWKLLWRFCNAYGPVVLWAGLIFLLSSQKVLPGFDIIFADYIFKKSAHIFVFAVLYALFFRGVNLERKTGHNWWLPFVFTFIYACLDEFHQSFTPFRHPSPIDVGFDMLGASLAFLKIYRYI